MTAADKKARSRVNKRRFIRLWSNVKRSTAYHGCDCYARAALIELLDRYTGINNGMIGLGVRELATSLRCGHTKAAKALRDLDDAGLIAPVRMGTWRAQEATEWRLTFYRCDATGAPPVTKWPPARVRAGERRSPRSVTRGRFVSALGNTNAEKANKPESAVSALGNTYRYLPYPSGAAGPREGHVCPLLKPGVLPSIFNENGPNEKKSAAA